MRLTSCLTLLLLGIAAPAVAQSGVRRVEAGPGYVLELAPHLELQIDRRGLVVESPRAKARLPLPYGSSSRGFPDALDYALVAADGRVSVHYQSFCGGLGLDQTTSLAELGAKLLVAEAERRPALQAKALVEQAAKLAPSDPSVAVASAAQVASAPGRAEALLAPALASAPFETYVELARRAPALLELPSVRKLRAATAGDARLAGDADLYALAGPYLALSVAAETEADCASTEELLLLDVRSGAVVFRRPFLERDDECRETRVNTRELERLLGDFGFRVMRDTAQAEPDGLGHYRFALAKRLQLDFDFTKHRVRAHRGKTRLWTKVWRGDESPRRATLLPEAHTILLETNRDSDVCEGLPAFELLPAG